MLYFIEGTRIEVKICPEVYDSYYNITATKITRFSYKRKEIFKVRIKREFIEHIKNVIETNRKAFVNLKNNSYVSLKVKDGFLKAKTKIYRGTKITVSVIVDDAISFGKIKVRSSELLKIYYSIVELEQHGD